MSWARSFSTTVAVELLVAGLPMRRGVPSLALRVGLVCIANVLTHPMVWFALPKLGMPYLAYVLVAETVAVVVEALVYRRAGMDTLEAFALSAMANGASFLIGIPTMIEGRIPT